MFQLTQLMFSIRQVKLLGPTTSIAAQAAMLETQMLPSCQTLLCSVQSGVHCKAPVTVWWNRCLKLQSAVDAQSLSWSSVMICQSMQFTLKDPSNGQHFISQARLWNKNQFELRGNSGYITRGTIVDNFHFTTNIVLNVIFTMFVMFPWDNFLKISLNDISIGVHNSSCPPCTVFRERTTCVLCCPCLSQICVCVSNFRTQTRLCCFRTQTRLLSVSKLSLCQSRQQWRSLEGRKKQAQEIGEPLPL